MSKPQINAVDENNDEKAIKTPFTKPKATVELAQEYAPEATSEGERILGMTRENSGWDVYNNEARKVDTELVKDWTTSLNFLLIFAAIFAAVLTAFIIESKKMLEPDPMNTMVDVVIFYTNNVANGTHMPYNRTDFEADTSAVVVNCLFFTSLSASLFAALASVVALQRYFLEDERRQFRYAGVISWKMSEIIAALPLMLYFSVILFFAGLILWMWVTNHAVGAVVAAGTAAAVLFYVTSTMIAVAFVSAPFRTPLSRGIYSLFYLPYSVLYWLMRAMRVSTIPSWVKTRHALYTTAYRREDQAVEERETLGRDALIWLANQLSISQDSHRRLLLLVGELPSLKAEQLPSFNSTDALWCRIFDLLGWRYLSRGSSVTVSGEERRRGMEILQRCYKLPVIQKLVDPVEREELTEDNRYTYWSQYCDLTEGGQWTISHDRPNHLFILLRDIPSPSQFSSQEIEVTARLSQWRNRAEKDPQAWNEVFSNATSLPSEFFSACVTTFGNFCSGETWIFRDIDKRQLYTSIARKTVQIAAQRDDLQPVATVPLVRAYEALLVGFLPLSGRSSSSYLTSPFIYGKALQRGSADDHATHAHMTLLLSRQLHSDPEAGIASQVKNVIAMLWLRPSNRVSRDWHYLDETHGSDILVDMMSDWIRNAESIPHILEILQCLARAQRLDPAIGPLWRTSARDGVKDLHFVEALQTFDRLIGMGCTNDDHYVLINLVCQDLELEPFADFDHYFTPSRLESLVLLNDHCLRVLVDCARGPDFLSPVAVPKVYSETRRHSLNRVAEYVHKRFSSINSPAALQLQASLWPVAQYFDRDICPNAMQDTMAFDLLQRVFRYPVPCAECLDGPGHPVSHLLSRHSFKVTHNATLFGKLQLTWRYMRVTCIILSTLDEDKTFSLAGYFPEVDEYILRTLEEEIHEIIGSQFLLLVMIWNTLEEVESTPEQLGAVVVGIRKALRLRYDPKATRILGPLSLKLLRIGDDMFARGHRSFTERELVKREATVTSHLLLTNLAVRSIFGRLNSHCISCVQAVGDVQPALGWLPPHNW